jgi:hypothetical protein
MDISAHAIVLWDKSRNGLVGLFACAEKTDPPSSCHPLADLGG